MTEEEYAQKQLDIETHISLQDEITAKAKAKAALLERLGITDKEAQLLLGGN
jgi:L-lysine 2,3-aminomutase